ncbi:interferon gamma receptor 1-like [Labeo rohita]|nr:interferon gamma receptor 1-like [Labeo rohita]
MTMSNKPVVHFGVFCALLLPVCGYVPSPTNVSVVCHNFVNVLYWNYSNPTEQLKFSVNIDPYMSESQTADTFQTYLDISSYSRDASDDYSVSVTAHDGQEKSKSVSITFTYSKDFFDESKHKYKCSLDFPPVNASVHKDTIEVSFQHPFLLHKQSILNEEFGYTITHNEQKVSNSCFEDEDLCIVDFPFNQSATGECVQLKFEGEIAGILSYTYRNVCVPQQTPETSQAGLLAALLGGGTVMLFIFMGIVWLFWRKWSKIPPKPEFLCRSPGQFNTMLVSPHESTVSPVAPQGHTPLLKEDSFSYGSPPISPTEKDCKANTILNDTVVDLPEEVSEEDVNDDNSEGFCRSSDYDSPKFLQEMSPGDITEGYGPRPPVL